MAAVDTFATVQASITSPYTDGEAVTPHDTNELTNTTRAIYVGGGGNIALVTSDGTALTLVGLLVGTIYPIRAKIIKSTSTTATNIVGLF